MRTIWPPSLASPRIPPSSPSHTHTHTHTQSQGYGFCEFADGAVVDGVIKSLHNSLVEGRKITVKRADDDAAPSTSSG